MLSVESSRPFRAPMIGTPALSSVYICRLYNSTSVWETFSLPKKRSNSAFFSRGGAEGWISSGTMPVNSD